MKKTLVDHWWSKMVEHGNGVGPVAVRDKLEELKSLETKIRNAEGDDVARNVLDDGMIRRALERMLEIYEGNHSGLDFTDLHIFHRYATNAAEAAELVIDNELPHLGL